MGFWQYDATQKFFYTPKKSEDSRVLSGEQIISDWNREIKAKENTHFFINGKSIASIRNNEEFKDKEDLKKFFINHLFSQVTDSTTQENLAEQALLLLHQGGLPFASHHCLVYLPQAEKRIRLPGEKIKVNFVQSPEGVLVTEENTYPQLMIDKEFYETDSYYAKTESQMLFSDKGIEIKKLTIDCPDRYAAELLDSRSFMELFKHLIEKLLSLFPRNDLKAVASVGNP